MFSASTIEVDCNFSIISNVAVNTPNFVNNAETKLPIFKQKEVA